MTRIKFRWVFMAGAVLLGSLTVTPQKTQAGWGYAYRAPVRAYRHAYRPAVPYRRAVASVVVPRAVYRPVAPVVAAPYHSGYRGYSPSYPAYRGYSPYTSGYRGYSPYTSGYRGLNVTIGYGVAPVGYLGY